MPWEINLAPFKDSWQHSVYSNMAANRANDENFHPSSSQNSCAMTNNAHHAWWAVDLEDVYEVSHVILTNRDSSREFSH